MIADAGHDASEALADAGLDAAADVLDAGASALDGGVDSGADARAQEAGDGLPRSHWILRDNSGAAVEAEVQPTAGASRFGLPSGAVQVNYFGEQEIGLRYSLKTGALLPDEVAATWRDRPRALFLGADCTTDPVSTGPSRITQVGGKFYYNNPGLSYSLKGGAYYQWSGGKCVSHSVDWLDVWVFKTVPASIVGLLDRAPYKLEHVY
jgi:hypothetical protein